MSLIYKKVIENMRKHIVAFIIIILLSPSLSHQIYTQAEFRTDMDLVFHNIYYDLVQYPSLTDDTELKIFLEVCFDWLLFVKSDEMFVSTYEFTVLITGEDDEVAVNQTYEKKFALKEFKRTNSTTDFVTIRDSHFLKPGKYEVQIEFLDINSKKSFNSKKEIKVLKHEENKPRISDILFVNRFIKEDNVIKRVIPNVEKKFNNVNKNFYAYFEAISPNTTGAFKIQYEIEDFKKDIVSEGEYEFNRTGNREPVVINLGNLNLYSGKYTIFLSLREGRTRKNTKKSFLVYWVGVPNTKKDLELALEQMKYIPGSKSEINRMKKLPFEEKRKAFHEYWKKKDPYPDTPHNEFMNGYFNRIANSNEFFASSITSREGWQTDMGMVYVLFGPPNEIERHPFDMNSKPYQVWLYYSINRSFVFVDEIGFGLYRLTNPISYHEHEVLRF